MTRYKIEYYTIPDGFPAGCLTTYADDFECAEKIAAISRPIGEENTDTELGWLITEMEATR